MIAFIAFSLVGFSKWFNDNNILHWINPIRPQLSDDFSNDLVFRLMQHSRLFWFLVIGGLWVIGLLCVRCYGKGLFRSILYNSRKVYIPLLAVALISSGGYAYKNQPNIYLESEVDQNSKEDNKELELSNTNLEIAFDTSKGSLSGKATYSLQNLSGSEQECTITINPGYTCHNITANGKVITFKSPSNKKSSIIFTLPADPKINIEVEYSGVSKMREEDGDLIVAANDISDKGIDIFGAKAIYPQLMVLDSKTGVLITGKFTMPAGLMPIVYGQQHRNDEDEANNKPIVNVTSNEVKLISDEGKSKTWSFKANGESFFAIMAGDYVVKKLGDEDMPIEFYYSHEMAERMKNMSAEKVMDDTIKYCTDHYGKLRNVSRNNPLRIVQRTIFSGGGWGLANLSTMPESSFSDKRLSDKSRGAATGAEMLGHELAHQWFGFQTVGEGGNNENWSAEGLAVYTTYRIAKETQSEEYAQKNYVEVWKQGSKEQDNNFYNRHPEYLEMLPEKYADEISDCNRVARQYEKLPLQILKAAKLVGGEDKMDKILARLYEKSQKAPITWQDFLDDCGLKEEDLNIE